MDYQQGATERRALAVPGSTLRLPRVIWLLIGLALGEGLGWRAAIAHVRECQNITEPKVHARSCGDLETTHNPLPDEQP